MPNGSFPWAEPGDIAVSDALVAAVGGHPLLAQALARRGIVDIAQARAFLDPDQYQPTPASELPGLTAIADRLQAAIARAEPICVWGDFDVDGQTATTILVATLRELGATVTYHIPLRDPEGHGITIPALDRVLADGARVLLTCDTGISAHEAVAHAQARGVDVLITDHHDLPATLPPARALVNPKLLPDDHPLRELPGAGCAYKLAEELLARAGREAKAAGLLDLVALGIVADLARLTGDVRYLTQRGVGALRYCQRVGMRAILETAELDAAALTEEHIAFEIAPRLNALGRLADANAGVELLTTQDLGRARILASQIEALNAQRRLLCDQVFQAAQAQIERTPQLLEDAALVLTHPQWPAGVLGIVASRLVEQYRRPAVLIATPPGKPARGSARSVEGCNITAAIAAQSDLLLTFGGHPMAAGLTIDPERVPEFRRRLCRSVAAMCPGATSVPLRLDGYLPLADLSLDFVAALERLAPFGPGNPPLVLVSRDLTVVRHSTIGRTGEHRQVTVRDAEGHEFKALWWQGGDQPLPTGRFDLAYSVRAGPGSNGWQIEWIAWRAVDEAAIAARDRVVLQVVDYRRAPDPRDALERLRATPSLEVWREGDATLEGNDRDHLAPTSALAIWTAPPGPGELAEAMRRTRPQTVYLFAIDPGLDAPLAFLQRLVGLIKYAWRTQDGRMRLSALAAATAQREATVRAGIAWLAARGDLRIVRQEDDEIEVLPATDASRLQPPLGQLAAFLEETIAYRSYLREAPLEILEEAMIQMIAERLEHDRSRQRGSEDASAGF